MNDGTPPSNSSSSSGGGGGAGGSGGNGSASGLAAPSVIGTVSGISVASAKGAQDAIAIIDGALSKVGLVRARLGAVTGRLGTAISSLSTQQIATSGSVSRIRDADMAVTTSKLVKGQILRQSAQYVISASHLSGRNALGLLR